MSRRPQAHDIIRTWAVYTIVKSWIHHGEVPWRDVMVSGHVQASGGVKIGKSKGNAPADPREVIERHGADATRYWALSATLGNDYLYSEEDLKSGRRLCVKLWNAARLAKGHLEGHDPRAAAPALPIDAWIRSRLADTVRRATQDLERFEFGIAKGVVERFFWGDLCDNYLEMVKNRLYDESDAGRTSREAARATLYEVLRGVTRLLAPFVPHVCEALWQDLFREREGVVSVGRAPWPVPTAPDAEAEADGEAALAVLTALRRWRSEHGVSPGKALASARVRAATGLAERFARVREPVLAAGRVARLDLEADAALAAGFVALDEVAP
jgi:valyl-tRNA synthetase